MQWPCHDWYLRLQVESGDAAALLLTMKVNWHHESNVRKKYFPFLHWLYDLIFYWKIYWLPASCLTSQTPDWIWWCCHFCPTTNNASKLVLWVQGKKNTLPFYHDSLFNFSNEILTHRLGHVLYFSRITIHVLTTVVICVCKGEVRFWYLPVFYIFFIVFK